MSSLQSPSAPGEPSPMQADSFGQALAAERQAREQRTPDWPPWMAPAALVGGVVLSMVGVLIVELPAAAFGVDITASHMPAGQVPFQLRSAVKMKPRKRNSSQIGATMHVNAALNSSSVVPAFEPSVSSTFSFSGFTNADQMALTTTNARSGRKISPLARH